MSVTDTAIAKSDHRSAWTYAIAGVLFGLLAGILNNIWILVFPYVTPYEVPKIPGLLDVMRVSVVSFLAMLIASLVYFLFTMNNDEKGTKIFQLLGFLGLLGSLYIPMRPEQFLGDMVYDGFAIFTIPMHVITAVIAVWAIPRFIHSDAMK